MLLTILNKVKVSLLFMLHSCNFPLIAFSMLPCQLEDIKYSNGFVLCVIFIFQLKYNNLELSFSFFMRFPFRCYLMTTFLIRLGVSFVIVITRICWGKTIFCWFDLCLEKIMGVIVVWTVILAAMCDHSFSNIDTDGNSLATLSTSYYKQHLFERCNIADFVIELKKNLVKSIETDSNNKNDIYSQNLITKLLSSYKSPSNNQSRINILCNLPSIKYKSCSNSAKQFRKLSITMAINSAINQYILYPIV